MNDKYALRLWGVLEKCGIIPERDEFTGKPLIWITTKCIAVEVPEVFKDATQELFESIKEFDWIESRLLSNGNWIVKAEVLLEGNSNEIFKSRT